MDSFEQRLNEAADRVTVALDALLPRAEGPEAHLNSAMRYAALGPGKRLRPFLAVEAGRLVNADERGVLRAACALECIHAYSLIHDDLPCMDDDDMRRGRPTVHKAYDEATAVLAGDALQAAAFEILAHPDTHQRGSVRSRLVERLARASGPYGMVGGQMIDIRAETEQFDISVVTRMHRMKTGALINYAVEIGTILREVEDHIRRALEGFAHDLGLAYQITDDLLDATGDQAEMGKAAGKDAGQGKATFVTILGVEGARDRSRHLAAQAKDHLEPFGARAEVLREAVDFILDRRS
ncbi:MAG: farnesyl-diphosphate synthase [Oceanicaulis sp.]|uniref:Farnesyl-diphosphate synthase n=1 Tax=Maricaulis virginensis TaxID=144022 RepID=A0A9W6MMA6_9PROT|nr:farnesyl diphosphate synthase [Maricaulis virginensis]MAC38661.1 farnesyl-diphosphate synthase [Oceanicaulis sp.]MAZ92750.1 farnesyl-diphosphate synthase [Maricaulis sp.]MBI75330.1 farnesyl-diphosphate synthase [Oceanicaulis sp.]GLK50624.1 farnesyl-diphosphate synthase [Maricaulis virginensis]|tara:strand:+ start:311 stop:1198 length:888 start_codon:yes stop_codon:yes gene_type:complete